MTKQEQFFYSNAGYSYKAGEETPEQGRLRCAVEMAKAECWAKENSYDFVIDSDPDADESFMDNETEEYQAEWRGKAWFCQMVDRDGDVVQSLSSCFGDSDYERVVKAELALEQMHECAIRDARIAGYAATGVYA